MKKNVLFGVTISFKINTSKTEGMWEREPFKALGVYYSMLLNYFTKRITSREPYLDSAKKLVNVWSSSGFSVFVGVTVVKSLFIPKFFYILSPLPAPNEIVQELNRILFKFLWKGMDKVRRLSTINGYENSGLEMIDLESTVKSLRLAWLKRIFRENEQRCLEITILKIIMFLPSFILIGWLLQPR